MSASDPLVLCLVFLMLSRLFIAASWSTAWKGLPSWLLLVMFIVFFGTFLCGILGQVWYLIVSFPDLCRLSYFDTYYSYGGVDMFNGRLLQHNGHQKQ